MRWSLLVANLPERMTEMFFCSSWLQTSEIQSSQLGTVLASPINETFTLTDPLRLHLFTTVLAFQPSLPVVVVIYRFPDLFQLKDQVRNVSYN